MPKNPFIIRDISWLSFNARVLQEARDEDVPLRERIRFLGIYSNNMDEFFRVRVATLRRMTALSSRSGYRLEIDPEVILNEVQERVLAMQIEFDRAWTAILRDLKKRNILLITERKLNAEDKRFVLEYFDEQIRSYIVPLMIESMQSFPTLNDKSLYLACRLSKSDKSIPDKFALVSVPTRHLPRFLLLPAKGRQQKIILLEDVIRLALPRIFSFLGYDSFSTNIIKVTRDAEIDIDNDMTTSLMQKIEKGLKSRKKGKPVRFVYDKDIDPHLLNYLVRRLGLSKRDTVLAGSRIHNFKDFMNFPDILNDVSKKSKPFTHPLLRKSNSVSDIILNRDIMLSFPYHSFDSLIDLLREAAIDPTVASIKISCYRLAPRSKVINALVNALRNGKQVTVMMELRARFDEEANLAWKKELEDEGARVLIGVPGMKVHAKICVIRKKVNDKNIYYGFVGTGNLNEKTAPVYADHFLLTADRGIMADINRIFSYLENPSPERMQLLKGCQSVIVSPVKMRAHLLSMINNEIRQARKKKPAAITLKLNSLSDSRLIEKLSEAATAGVEIRMVIRGICCMKTENSKFKKPIKAVSIVDEYLEHARVIIFHNRGNEKVYITSADWMIRNLDNRIEASCPVIDPTIIRQLKDILELQLKDNVKARILDNEMSNQYINPRNNTKVRSQVSTYNYLRRKKE